MDFALIALVAALASALTLYSGFGLGTILLPVFVLFLPVPMAVAATGVVHLLNNLFKGGLLFRRADWRTVASFGLPAIPAAIAGAWILAQLGNDAPLFAWLIKGHSFGPTAAGLTIGVLMILFAVLELQRWFQNLRASPRMMPVGGAISGFFGGLTGQQGALRSIFLLRSGLDAEGFIATGTMVAILVDLSRLATYAAAFPASGFDPAGREMQIVLVGAFAAFAGAWFATRRLKKLTLGAVRYSVAALMAAIGTAMTLGLIG